MNISVFINRQNPIHLHALEVHEFTEGLYESSQGVDRHDVRFEPFPEGQADGVSGRLDVWIP